jgi:hypothetical protein
VIRLVGPGGAGKTTTGALLAERLAVNFFDLDRHFTAKFGDISEYISRDGNDSYVLRCWGLLLNTTEGWLGGLFVPSSAEPVQVMSVGAVTDRAYRKFAITWTGSSARRG